MNCKICLKKMFEDCFNLDMIARVDENFSIICDACVKKELKKN